MNAAPTVSAERDQDHKQVVIVFGGKEYVADLDMAEIFLRHALEVTEPEDERLVPLLHQDGVELLLVTPDSPIAIGSC